MSLKPKVTTSASLQLIAPTQERPISLLSELQPDAIVVAPHRHTEHAQLLVPAHGVIRVMSHTAIWIVPPTKAIVIPANFEHSMVAPSGTRLLAVNVHPSVFSDDLAGGCRVVHIGRLTSALLDAIGADPRDYPLNSPASRKVDVLIDQLRLADAEPFRLPRPSDPRARGIADGLVAEPGNPLTLSQWGKLFGASERTLARIFETETGMGFREYRRQVQIHAAMGLLVAGMSIGDVAYDLGYESTSAFIFAFRTVTGSTPGRFRRAKVGKDELL
ncbi:helix-turn-helix domain-containing protein [Rhizobium sp.]|uniref:helix-turn-helix domain-containing protein n=1 Tax=Rhizobium sp. TaxID=391 RepID=UPI002F0FCACA